MEHTFSQCGTGKHMLSADYCCGVELVSVWVVLLRCWGMTGGRGGFHGSSRVIVTCPLAITTHSLFSGRVVLCVFIMLSCKYEIYKKLI